MTTGQRFIKLTCLLATLVFLTVTGCTTATDSLQSERLETLAPGAITVTLTPTETATATRTPLVTRVPVPTAVVETPTVHLPQATLTSAPSATLTTEQKAENLDELMQGNGGCELPCWWGINLGSTKFAAARQNLMAKGLQFGDDDHARIRVGDVIISTEFDIEQDTVHSANVRSSRLAAAETNSAFTQSWQRYSLAETLNRHGTPTRVLVYSPFRADPGGGPGYHLLVFYETLGIVIQYRGSARQLNGPRYRACPDLEDVGDIALFLYQPQQVKNVVERVLPAESVSYITGPDTVYEQISWQQATGTSLQHFYVTFSISDNDACFDFSI